MMILTLRGLLFSPHGPLGMAATAARETVWRSDFAIQQIGLLFMTIVPGRRQFTIFDILGDLLSVNGFTNSVEDDFPISTDATSEHSVWEVQ